MSGHRLADGRPVELGMRVVDYDRKHGLIEDSERNRAELAKPHSTRVGAKHGTQPITPEMDAAYTCESWFDVVRDEGGKSYMDCSRMVAEGGRLDR